MVVEPKERADERCGLLRLHNPQTDESKLFNCHRLASENGRENVRSRPPRSVHPERASIATSHPPTLTFPGSLQGKYLKRVALILHIRNQKARRVGLGVRV